MFEYRVIVTGSRDFDNYTIMDNALYDVWHQNVGYGTGNKLTIIEGGARGADTMAKIIARENPDTAQIEEYLADWHNLGKSAGPIRNQQMLDSGADLVLAFYKTGAANKGTQDMVDRAEKAGIEVRTFWG